MKTTKQILLALAIVATSLSTFAQEVGIGTTTPEGKLDVVSTNTGLVVPRVANTAAVTNPQGPSIDVAEGTIIYDESASCFKVYQDSRWSNCLAEVSFGTANADASTIVYNGQSVIDNIGIGYNGEKVPAASTISIDVTTTQEETVNLSAQDPNTGLIYTGSATFNAAGTQTITLTPNGISIPVTTFGILTMPLTGVNNSVNLKPRIDIKSIPAQFTVIRNIAIDTDDNDGDGDATTCGGNGCEQVWMDRNLGARQTATGPRDGLSLGNLYQWGRGSDGHEILVTKGEFPSNTSTAFDQGSVPDAVDTPTPGLSEFIESGGNATEEWLNQRDNTLWNTGGITNPCPSGYRVPTDAEFSAMISALGITNISDAQTSALAFPAAGGRLTATEVQNTSSVGSEALYWTTTIGADLNRVNRRAFFPTTIGGGLFFRESAYSVRCIRD